MGIAELIHDKREEILRIAAKHGAQRIRVFGVIGDAPVGAELDACTRFQSASGTATQRSVAGVGSACSLGCAGSFDDARDGSRDGEGIEPEGWRGHHTRRRVSDVEPPLFLPDGRQGSQSNRPS